MTEKSPQDLLEHLETLTRVGCKRKVAEAKLRSAVELVAEKVAVLVGEPCSLSRGYMVVNTDPESSMTGSLPRPRYLVLVSMRSADGYVKSQALSPVPNDAQDRFDWPPAGRLALTQFAEAVQNGWLFRVAEIVDARADQMARLATATELAGKALS